jgi:HEAT repeat protein
VVRHEVRVTKQDQRFVIALPSAPVTFRFDEGGWLLGTVHTDQTPDELSELARHDLDLAARWWALSALDSSSAPVARDARRFIALNDPVAEMRAEAIRQIGTHDRSTSHDVLASSLGDPSGLARGQAIRSLAIGDTAAVQGEAVRMITTDPSFYVQAAAVSVYDPASAPQGTALLVDRIQHGGSLGVRVGAAERLAHKPDAAGLDALESMTAEKEPRAIRTIALTLLSAWPDKTRGVSVATRYLDDGDPLFASAAAEALGKIGGDAAKATLRRAAASESRVTVKAAIVRAMSGK